MANKKQVSDAEIVAAMVTSRTRAEAAEKLKLDPRTLYERLKSYDVQASIAAHRADALRTQMQTLEDVQSNAVKMIYNVMVSDESTNAEKLKAAAMLLDYGRIARQEIAAADADAIGKQRGAHRMDKEAAVEERRLNGERIFDFEI